MWNTVLFDLDGTISDSAQGITRCVQYALEKEFGIIRNPEELLEFVGPPLREQFMLYTGCNEAMGERAVERYRERYRPVGIYENRLYSGIPELLAQLKDEGFTIALSSSKPEEFCRQILETFGIVQYFDVICGSDMAGNHTSKAEIVENVLYRLDLRNRRSEVVLVGDRKYDIEGAKQCGISSIGVSYGYGSREELESVWPDCIVDTVTELRNVLVGQAREEGDNPSIEKQAGMNTGKGAAGNVIFKIWRIGYPVLLHYGMANAVAISVYMILMLFWLVTGGKMSEAASVYASHLVVLTGLADLSVIPVALFFFRSDEAGRRIKSFTGNLLNLNNLGLTEILCISGMIIGFSTILNMIIAYLPINDAVYEEMAEQMFRETPFLIQLIVVGIVAPVAEEFIFRGLVFRRIRDYCGFMWAAIGSGLIFGIYHGNLTQGVFAFIMGMLFAAVYEHYGTMWAPIAAHICNNLFATIENRVFRAFHLPNAVYLIYLGIVVLVSVFCFVWILTREERVNIV